jgi:hypothetical protein
VATRNAISRRRFLRGAGIVLSLPLLDSMVPAFASITSRGENSAATTPGGKPRRMFAICKNLGLLPDQFFPRESGRDYKLSPYLEILREHRKDFTVFSGVSHPDVDGGHPADNCFLTAAPHPGRAVSATPFRSINTSANVSVISPVFPRSRSGSMSNGQRSLSWTSSGVLIPCEEKASDVFRRLFMQGSEEEVQKQVRRLELGESILDVVADRRRNCSVISRRATVIGSTNISRACAISNSAWRCPANGNTSQSPP